MENDEDLVVHEIMGFLRYLRACAEHDAPFDLKAHIPRIESLIKDYDEAVSKENFNSISEGLIDAIAIADQPIDPSLKQGRDLRLDIDRKLLALSMGCAASPSRFACSVCDDSKPATDNAVTGSLSRDPDESRPSDVAAEITEVEDERVLATALGASGFQVWENEGAYSVPVQFAEEVAALGELDCPPIADDLPRVVATVQTAEAVLSAAGEEEDDIGYRAIVQLAGCLTVAEGHIEDDVRPGVYGYSLAYEKVALLRRAFDLLADGRSPQQVIDDFDLNEIEGHTGVNSGFGHPIAELALHSDPERTLS